MTKYLLTFHIDDEFFFELADMEHIANLVGCRDFNETRNHKVWLITPDALVPLVVVDEGTKLTVSLYDHLDHFVDSAEYPDH